MKKMKSKNKILAVTAFAMLSLMGCNIDPILTDSYSEDVAWSNVDNLRLNLNGFYSLIGGYYGSEVENDACTDILKMNGPRDSENLFVFGSAPITPAANPFNNWDNRHTWQLSCCRFLHNLAEHREIYTFPLSSDI
jgi:starch-binding outer membrane protein, SusD/RagB family